MELCLRREWPFKVSKLFSKCFVSFRFACSLPFNICQVQATHPGYHPPPNRFQANAQAEGLEEAKFRWHNLFFSRFLFRKGVSGTKIDFEVRFAPLPQNFTKIAKT